MRTLRLVLSAVLLLASAACQRDTFSPHESGPLAFDATRETGGIRLVNNTGRPVAYFAIESNTATLALWGACADPGPDCLRLPAGASTVIPLADVAGYEPGARSAIVYWWHVVPDPSAERGYRVTEIRSVVVEL